MRSLSLFILVSLLLFVGISPVLACTPTPTAVNNPPPHIPTLEEYVQTSPIIFTGRVSRELAFGGWGRLYEIEVENYLKGSGFSIVQIEGYGYGSDCLPTISIGRETVFFARERDNNEGIAVYYRMVDYPIEQVEEIIALTGQSLPAQALPLELQLSRFAQENDMTWIYAAGLVLLLVPVGIVLLWKWRFNPRKSKAKRGE